MTRSSVSGTVHNDTIILCTVCKEPLPVDGSPCGCRAAELRPDRGASSGLGADDEASVLRAALAPEYDVLEEVGRGGMAIVYRAIERALDRQVAIKVLPLAMTFDEDLVERFQQEARTAAGLEHPHIIPIHRVGQVGSISYIVMKFIDGPSLADLLKDGQRLPASQIHRMVLEVSDALDFAHRQGVVHRDIKPDNIMREESGRFVVADFGIAKSREASSLTQTGSSIGTPKYMSPEQGTGRPVDGSSDLYSLGVVAYHCLAGRPPFDGPDPLSVLHGHVNTPVPEPGLTDPEARKLFPVVTAMMEKEPERRPKDGAAIRSLIEGKTGPPSTLRPPSSSNPILEKLVRFRPTDRRGWALGLVPASLLTVLFLGRSTPEKRCREAVQGEDSGLAVLIDDFGALSAGRRASVDFHVCGLVEGATFAADMEVKAEKGGGVIGGVRRLFGGSGEANETKWEDRADGLATSRSRPIATANLEEGDYRITIRITAEDEREAEVSQRFDVVE